MYAWLQNNILLLRKLIFVTHDRRPRLDAVGMTVHMASMTHVLCKGSAVLMVASREGGVGRRDEGGGRREEGGGRRDEG